MGSAVWHVQLLYCVGDCRSYSMKPEVKDLDIELYDVIENWDNFAVQLPDITPAHISTAKVNSFGNIAQQKLKVYKRWLNVYPQASWNDVVDALNKAGLKALADSLSQRKLKPAGNVINIIVMSVIT